MGTGMRSRALALMAFSLAAVLAFAAPTGAQSSDPTPAEDWFEVDYAVAIDGNLTSLSLNGTLEIHETETPEEDDEQVQRILEDECDASCTADDLRRLYQEYPSYQDELVETLKSRAEDRTAAVLASMTEQPADADATVDRSALEAPREGSPYQDPIPIDVEASSPLAMVEDAGLTSEQVDAVFEMGARTDVPIQTMVDPGTNLTLSLTVPDPLALVDEEPPVSAAEWSIDNWDADAPAELDANRRVGNPDVVVPEREQVDVSVVMDLTDVDVHYLATVTGGTAATINSELSVEGSVHAIETPEGELPEDLDLPLLSADAIRIGIEAGLIPEDQLDSFEDQARSSIQDLYRSMAGQEVRVSGGIVPDTVETEAAGQPPGTGGPIRLDMGAEAPIDVPPEDEPAGAAGFELTRIPQGALELPALEILGEEGMEVSIVLPPGLEMDYERVAHGNATTSTDEDGNTVVTFTTDGSSQPATVQGSEIVVDSSIIWHFFWPLILFLVLVFVVLPAVVIFVVIRRRRDDEGGGGGGGGHGPRAAGSRAQGQPSTGQGQATAGEEPAGSG